MKYLIQKNNLELIEKSISIDPISEFRFSNEDQIFVYEETEYDDAKGFMTFAQTDFKFVIPDKSVYTYAGVLSETDASRLISQVDFIRAISNDVVTEQAEEAFEV